MFNLYYKKNENNSLFKSLYEVGFSNAQNYIPIYKQFFSLTETNYKNLNLNHSNHITYVTKTDKRNKFTCKINMNGEITDKICFFKFSPLLDPVKYMMGKYESLGETDYILLPELTGNVCHSKVLDPNNSAYVDSFFSYLISQLLHSCYFPHGVDFFGSFLGVQKEFICNIVDDIDYLHESTYFHKNRELKFKMENIDLGMLVDFDTRNYKKKLNIGNNISNENVETVNNDDFKDVFYLSDISNETNAPDLVFEFDLPKDTSRKTDSTCSSRSSNTNSSDVGDDDSEGSFGVDSGTNSDMYSGTNSEMDSEMNSDMDSDMDSDMEINGTIYNFPTQVICLECLDGTLDSLMNDASGMNVERWQSCLFQIIMTLVAYQKVFGFTHNDLHTNNIMFVETEKQYLFYRYNQKYYKVPTFGKIFKIIDFGRAIYKFNGKIVCSDSYHSKGDAATQYNCEPYFNSNKARLEPNMSFDLCRLGCALFDYFIEDIDNIDNSNPIVNLVQKWTQDDKGRNILYKKNGDERYPDFKLYKMIARTVHKHTPEAQLSGGNFDKYIVGRKKVYNKSKVVDIDKMLVMSSMSSD